MMINLHSCRWSYDEASGYCYERYGGNEYIKTGYHPPVQTWLEKWNLLWSVHSETGNIWTHAIGVMISLYFLWNTVFNTHFCNDHVMVFIESVNVARFLQSTIYHWLHNCSKSWNKNLECLDYCGTANKLFAGHMTWMYYALGPHSFLFGGYLIAQIIILLVTLIVIYKITFSSNVDFTTNENIRNGLYLAQQGLIYIVILHQLSINQSPKFFACFYVILFLSFYAIGLASYVTKYPEALWPGKFDTYFNSHQIMHVMILVATILERHAWSCLRDY